MVMVKRLATKEKMCINVHGFGLIRGDVKIRLAFCLYCQESVCVLFLLVQRMF